MTVGGNNALEISGSVFDPCGPPALGANGQATITIYRNTLQPNILTPVNDQPDYAGSHPSLIFAGSSSAPKPFQGNNVGVSFVRVDRSSHWLIGGDHDADGNIFIGVRAGLELAAASNIKDPRQLLLSPLPVRLVPGPQPRLRGEQRHDAIEHNVFRGSSWMIQSPGGEFRYNLLLDNINEAFFRFDQAGTVTHHNLLVNSGYQRLYSPSGGVTLRPARSTTTRSTPAARSSAGSPISFVAPTGQHQLASARNNVFTGFAYQSQTELFGAARRRPPTTTASTTPTPPS